MIGATQVRAERERVKNEQLKQGAAVWAKAHPRRSVWRQIYSFPLLYTGLSAATGALIGSTRGDAWQGAVIGAAAGSFIDVMRAGRNDYPYGAGMIAGAGLGAVIGQSAGSAVGGALIGVASGAVMDSIIYAETRRQE